MRVLGIAGSLRAGSHSARLLSAAGATLPEDVTLDVLGGLGDLPAYDADLDASEVVPGPVAAFRAAVGAADGLLVVTPEYNGSVPGVLKNAVDWASRPRPEAPLGGKPVAVVSHSISQFGGLWAAEDLVRILGIAGARPLDGHVSVPEVDLVLPDGADRLTDDELATRLDALVGTLAAVVREAAAPVGVA